MIIALQNCSLKISYIGTVEEIRNQQLRDAVETACRKVCETAAKLRDCIDNVFADIQERVLRTIDDVVQMPTTKAVLDATSKLSMPSREAISRAAEITSLSAPLLLQPAASNPLQR